MDLSEIRPSELKKHYPLILFVCFYILFGFLTYKLLPITNDEQYRYQRGRELLAHFTKANFNQFALLDQPNVNNFIYSGYTAFLNFLAPQFHYEAFHFLNYLFALPIFVIAYAFVYLFSKNRYLAIGACVLLVLSPNFFGQLGINPADAPFATFYLASLFAIAVSPPNKLSKPHVILLGVLFGITQSLRQIGFTLYLILIIFDLYSFSGSLKARARNVLRNFWKYLLIFIVANFVMVVTWPNFAINYFRNLYLYLTLGSNYYLWDHKLLFMGELLTKYQRPFYYLPLLQLITYPIAVIMFFLLSLGIFKKLAKNKYYFILFAAVLTNYVLYFALSPVLYDGIRHYLFLAPPVTLMAVMAFSELMRLAGFRFAKVFATALVLFSLTFGAYKTYTTFPYHYIYFNEIGRIFGNPYQKFDSDYFSATYRDAALWIRNVYLGNKKPAKPVKVYSCDVAFATDYYSYSLYTTTINRSEADLIICDYKNMLERQYKSNVLYRVVVDGNVLNFVIAQDKLRLVVGKKEATL